MTIEELVVVDAFFSFSFAPLSLSLSPPPSYLSLMPDYLCSSTPVTGDSGLEAYLFEAHKQVGGLVHELGRPMCQLATEACCYGNLNVVVTFCLSSI